MAKRSPCSTPAGGSYFGVAGGEVRHHDHSITFGVDAFNPAVPIKLHATGTRSPPASEPANKYLERLRVSGLIFLSGMLLSSSMRGSSDLRHPFVVIEGGGLVTARRMAAASLK